MRTDDARRLAPAGAVDALPLLIAAWVAWRVLATMALRLDHGFDLEWMEGGMLAHAWRLDRGLPLYPDPSPDFVAFVYPPGYPAVVAALAPVFGLDYALGRAISAASTVLAAVAIAVGGWRQGGSPAMSLCGGALFLSLVHASGAFYDLVRPDALAMALLAWSVVIGLERRAGAAEAAGLLLACAFAVKHNLAVFGIPLLVFQALLVSKRAGVRFAVASMVPALGFTAWMQWVSGGNFLRFILILPATHPLVGARAFPGTPLELAQALLPGLVGAALYLLARAIPRAQPAALALPVVLALVLGAFGPSAGQVVGMLVPTAGWSRHLGFGAVGLIAGLLPVVAIDGWSRRELDRRWLVGCLLAGVAYGIATWMRAHTGGFLNVLMPLHWTACFGFAVLAGRARARWPVVGAGLGAGFAAWALLWSAAGFDLERLVPTTADRDAGARVVAEIASACPPGPIHSPYAAWLPVQVGREPSAHLIGLWDIDYEHGPFHAAIADLERAAREHHWACVIEGGAERLEHGIAEHYRVERRLELGPGELMPKTGWRARPSAILLPRAE